TEYLRLECDLASDRRGLYAAQRQVFFPGALPHDDGAENRNEQKRRGESFVFARVHQSSGATPCSFPLRSQVRGNTEIYGVGIRSASSQVPDRGRRGRGGYLSVTITPACRNTICLNLARQK